MKKVNYSVFILLPVIGFTILLFSSFREYGSGLSLTPNPEEMLTIPEGINTILDKSCFGCHNSESSNDKAKEKLLLDKLPDLSKAKLVAKLDEIAEIVGKNEMPPEKFLAKYPDKALTKEESKQLKEWAEASAGELMK
jgi:hypothetical protein